MRIAVIAGVTAAILAAAFLTYRYFTADQLERAIKKYDNENYIQSINILNKLASTAGYEKGEQVYYFRCKAVNALAGKLENKYSKDLKKINSRNREEHRVKKIIKKLEKKILKINNRVGTNLVLKLGEKKGIITSSGKFYDEFTSLYSGSHYIEDLNFDELKKIEKSEPGKILQAITNFYAQYPGTIYIAPIIRMIFSSLQQGNISVKGHEELLKKLVYKYARRYPTSAEIQRIFICNGKDVNLRNSPGLEGQIVGKLKKDELLIQIEKSMDTMQVGDVRDYWYSVAALSGLRGWVFGKFLKALDVSSLSVEEDIESWTLEEYFTKWSDSNTPENWVHIPGGEKSAITFDVNGKRRIVQVESTENKAAGLFRRFDTMNNFKIRARARYISGDRVILFAVLLNNNRIYALSLSGNALLLSGRNIPIQTSSWHEYELDTKGEYAVLRVDGDVVLSRIPPSKVEEMTFDKRGVYCLYSGEEYASSAAMEFIKIGR